MYSYTNSNLMLFPSFTVRFGLHIFVAFGAIADVRIPVWNVWLYSSDGVLI
jgi:hypothetical protein